MAELKNQVHDKVFGVNRYDEPATPIESRLRPHIVLILWEAGAVNDEEAIDLLSDYLGSIQLFGMDQSFDMAVKILDGAKAKGGK